MIKLIWKRNTEGTLRQLQGEKTQMLTQIMVLNCYFPDENLGLRGSHND